MILVFKQDHHDHTGLHPPWERVPVFCQGFQRSAASLSTSPSMAAIRARWPRVEIMVRGGSHYDRPEAMAWCERNRVRYIFGLGGNKVLLGRVTDLAEQAAMGRLDGEGPKVRRYGAFQ
jgi:hypothetical protein